MLHFVVLIYLKTFQIPKKRKLDPEKKVCKSLKTFVAHIKPH